MTPPLPIRIVMPTLLAVVGGVLIALAYYDGLSHSEELLESETRTQLMSLGTRLATRVGEFIAAEPSGDAMRILGRVANEPHLQRIALVDVTGRVVAGSDNRWVGQPLASIADDVSQSVLHVSKTAAARVQLSADRHALSGLFPVLLPASVGVTGANVLWLEFDLAATKRLNYAKHIRRVWIMSAVVVAAFTLVWLYFSFAVTRRLQKILAAIEHTAGGALDRRAGVVGADELGRLGRGFDLMLTELTARRRAVAESESRYRSIIHAMNEGVMTVDAQGRIVTVNESIARIAGLPPTQFQERTVFDPRWQLCFEDGRPMSFEENPVGRVLRSGQSVRDFVLGVQRQDGALRWVTASCEPLLLDAPADGSRGEPGVLLMVADITERRVAEQQGLRDRERLASIVGSAMDGVISTDGDLRITLFNRAAEKIFGYSESEMLGQSLNRLLPTRFREGHSEMMRKFSDTSASKRSMGLPGEVVGVRANGEEFPIEASISRVSLGNETVLTVILRDISERKRDEAQREQLEAQLRQSQKMQSLGTLTGGIAHDFNNILTAISGNAKLAQLELQEANMPVPHPVRRSLAEIEKAAARATDLVRQVLAFGRRQEAQRVAVNLSQVVADALKFLRAMIPAMIEIRSRLPDNLPLVAVDATQVHQVITNLGSNAAHAIGDKPGLIDVMLEDIVLTAEHAHASVDLHAGRYLRLTFIDTGGGIDAPIVERIFEPFFTTKGLGQGTGLGLSVVHGIMKNHDGAIVVDSKPSMGTRFALYFPVSAQPLVAPQTDTSGARENRASGAGKTIIYIDDEEALVFLVTRVLERRGYKVLGFTEPAAALAELAKHPADIDALISDLAMPVMTGFDVVRQAHELRPDLTVVLVSGYVRPQDAEQAQKLDVRRLILKPDTVDGLALALHEVLEETAKGS